MPLLNILNEGTKIITLTGNSFICFAKEKKGEGKDTHNNHRFQKKKKFHCEKTMQDKSYNNDEIKAKVAKQQRVQFNFHFFLISLMR